MKLDHILTTNRKSLEEKWQDAIHRTYPLDTVGFMRRQKDPFQNPVGHRIESAVKGLLEALLKPGLDSDEIAEPLDDLVRIRAVQEFTPAQAIGIFYLLKSQVRELAHDHLADPELAQDLLAFESKLDTLVLLSLDIYVKCKAQVYEMRIKEIKNQHHMLVRHANRMCEPAEEPDTPI